MQEFFIMLLFFWHLTDVNKEGRKIKKWEGRKMSKSQQQPQEVFYKKLVLKSFTKLTEKHLFQSYFFNKVTAFRPAQKFFSEFCAIVKNTFFTGHLWWLDALRVKSENFQQSVNKLEETCCVFFASIVSKTQNNILSIAFYYFAIG